MLRTWPADAHDARLLGLQCWLAHALADAHDARPLGFNAEGLGS